ncbi:glutamine-hydrolyzing carbamoyl-phosphate synthase small subunit [Spelaeicoccus albus]|uniref:Carbamoyl phosphate synthase small chain n=1 Tax=Spelaeicoccus albus TaxID=1280376 RepID=A0A7Z0D4A4_9MICO|nr:glutamine-hydrolyzing carbamoyl-phosphate synthase small subunit [Spelaeicoccus albus]NYI68606.1 carbamoyl-phosphate synthase small subunit [Spelaeicoccus albus]
MTEPRRPATLTLEDGLELTGTAYGARGTALGEAVFVTAMTGYQETLTDPSYHRQIIVQTAPHIGNTGVNDVDDESTRIWAAGYVVRDAARRPSSWRSTGDLRERLEREGVVGIADVDTRALTRHLRDKGAMRMGIFSGPEAPDRAGRLQAVLDSPVMAGSDLAAEASTAEAYVVPAVGTKRFTVAAFDLGIKSMTPTQLAERGLEVHVLPANTSFETLEKIAPDGVFFSNGPGDPAAADRQVDVLRSVLDHRIPFFGICFGNQLLGRALGYGTYKLQFGHRGINQPVLDRETGKVEVTSQNHGFAVDAPLDGPSTAPYDDGRYGAVEVSHICLNDNVVEGLRALDVPAFSVQYHPESAAGPHDSRYLFDRFIDLMDRIDPTSQGAK